MVKLFLAAVALLAQVGLAAAPHVIECVDEQTNRGVPLVELETVDRVRYYTDSNGLVAFNEPGLMDQKVFFHVSSFGYEFPKDMFGYRGVAVETKPGATTKLKIKRTNIAERLYRVTGQGIYRDTMLAGRRPPAPQVPLLNARVVGQDSVQSIVYRNQAYFFWGDTSRLGYPLGNFSTTGAVAPLPGKPGGVDPSVGVPLKYFVDAESGFTRKMVPLSEEGPVWIDGLMTVKDDSGRERLLAHFSRQKSLDVRLERGLILFDDATETFKRHTPVPLETRLAPGGHPFRVTVDGQPYYYFPVPYPCVRVRADWKSVSDLSSYEAYTCLKNGALLDGNDPQLDRDASGKVRFAWRKSTPPIMPKELDEMVKRGLAKRDELPLRLRDADGGGKDVTLHAGSVNYNEFRKRYVMIGQQIFGDSMAGEIWYAESDKPEGPWADAHKVVTHRRETGQDLGKRAETMDLYNPMHHAFLDQQGGRVIYFEGTYTNSFSGNPTQTPRYEYNQVMYRLDLADPRLKLP
jgi:hypothetical protein